MTTGALTAILEGMKKSVTRIATVASATITTAALVAIGFGAVNAAAAAQRTVESQRVMTAAAPAYLGTMEYGSTLDALTVDSVEAKKAADAAAAEAARVAAEQAAAAEAARVAAEAEAQRVATEQAAAAEQETDAPAADAPSAAMDDTPAPTLCPAGTTAGAVDGDGNESNCQATGTDGQPCVEYNNANECVAWYKP